MAIALTPVQTSARTDCCAVNALGNQATAWWASTLPGPLWTYRSMVCTLCCWHHQVQCGYMPISHDVHPPHVCATSPTPASPPSTTLQCTMPLCMVAPTGAQGLPSEKQLPAESTMCVHQQGLPHHRRPGVLSLTSNGHLIPHPLPLPHPPGSPS